MALDTALLSKPAAWLISVLTDVVVVRIRNDQKINLLIQFIIVMVGQRDPS